MSKVHEQFLAYHKAAYAPPDGVSRDLAREEIINKAFFDVSETAAGQEMLAVIRAMVPAAVALGSSNAAIRERNTLAWMIHVIDQRIEHGRHGRPSSSR